MEKRLSLIVPAYNMEAYLPTCLASVELPKEFMRLLEIIVVNDGSSDRTSEIAHAFADRYPESVRVIDKPNGHYGSCVNAALAVAHGTFVKVLDADDTFSRDCLVAFLAFLGEQAKPLPDLVLNDYEVVDANARLVHREILPFASERVFDLKMFLNGPDVVTMHAFTYRTELLRETGYRQLEGTPYTDQEWTLLPLAHVRRVIRFPQVLYRYLLGRSGQTMAPSELARGWSRRAEVAVDIAEKQVSVSSAVPDDCRIALTWRLAVMIAEVYRGAIFDDPCGAGNFDLVAFDRSLAERAPVFYELLMRVPYSRRIPYRFVHAWRRHVWWRVLGNMFCRVYTRVVRLVCAWRHG